MPVTETLMLGALGLGAVYYAKKQVEATGKETPPQTGTTVYNITLQDGAKGIGLPDNPAPKDNGTIRDAMPTGAIDLGGEAWAAWTPQQPWQQPAAPGTLGNKVADVNEALWGVATFGVIQQPATDPGQTRILGIGALFSREAQYRFGEWQTPGKPDARVQPGTPGAIWVSGTRSVSKPGALAWLGL